MREMILRLALVAAAMIAAGSPAAAQKPRASVSAGEVNGTYKMNFRGKYARFSNEIKLLALGRGKIRFSMDLVYPYTLRTGEPMVNMGGLDGEADIVGDLATYRSTGISGTCEIKIRFLRPGSVAVTQSTEDHACGFGHNVTADGTYRKVSARRPNF
jgi:hypothetical protein